MTTLGALSSVFDHHDFLRALRYLAPRVPTTGAK
jgi:hypothetical protein